MQQDGGAGARYFSPSPRAGGCAWPSFAASALPIYTNCTILQKYVEQYPFCLFRRLSGPPAAPNAGYPRFFQGFYISRIIQFVLFLQNISNCILFIPCRRPARRGAAGGLSQITNTRRPPGEGQRAVYRRRQRAPPGAEKRTVCRKWQHAPPARSGRRVLPERRNASDD